MDNIRIQDDLYHHVNQEWLENAVIPDDKPTTGGFANLAKEVEELMINEFSKMAEDDSYPDEHLRRAVTLFKKVRDVEARKASGAAPTYKTLALIEAIKDIDSFNKSLKEFVYLNIPLPFNFDVEADMKDTNHHVLMIQGPSVILPDTTYYSDDKAPQRDMLLNLWKGMASEILKHSPLSSEDQAQYLEDTLAFDRLIAKFVKSSEEWSEYVKMYNPLKIDTFARKVRPVAFKAALKEIFGAVPSRIISAEPRYFKHFNEVFSEETFLLYKHWAYVKELVGSCSVLSEELRELGGTYSRALSGIAKMSSIDKFAYQLASSIYSEPVGYYYGRKYFGEEAKKDIIDIVNDIVKTYQKRIKNNDFLEEQTKEKAILKLSKMNVHMAYPDKVDEFYDSLTFNEDDTLYDIIAHINRIKRQHSFDKLYKEVDRDRWVMPGHMVNACYNPFTNDITFPAGILQAPFYSIKQTRSENLGGIGAVIGHEISHAFDNNGAKCDENGNINNWWTKEDTKHFEEKTKAMIEQFDGIELPWGVVNGAFIVSENIADNGGMASTLDIMKHMENANYEEYFINWAKVWCVKAREEYLKLLLAVDVHGPALLRANMQPRNFPEWYETFGVTSEDKMYIPEDKRVVIW